MPDDQPKQTMSIEEKRIYIFYAITFGLGYLLVGILYFTGGLTSSTELWSGTRLVTVVFTAFLVLPAVGNILTRLITKEGWKDLYLRPNLDTGWKYWLLAWLGIPVLIGIGAWVFYYVYPAFFDPELNHVAALATAQGRDLTNSNVVLNQIAAAHILTGILLSPILKLPIAFGNEFGWRGYLQPKLMEMGPRKAVLITGFSWGLFLAPVVAMGYTYGYYKLNYAGAPYSGIAMIVFSSIYISVVLGWLTFKSRSLWPSLIGYSLIVGVSEYALIIGRGIPPLVQGPTVNGFLGGVGFILASMFILWAHKSFVPTAPKPRKSWKSQKDKKSSKNRHHR